MRLVLWFLLGLVALSAAPVQEEPEEIELSFSYQDPATLYEELTNATPEASSARPVADVELTRGPASLRLDEGVIFPFEASGRSVGGVFVGRGVFVFEPPEGIEADQLEKFTEKRRLEQPFTRALLAWTDGTGGELALDATAPTTAEPEARKATRFLERRMEHYRKKLYANPRARLLQDLVEGREGYFAAELDTLDFHVVSFVHDPRQEEQVMLGRWSERFRGFMDIWCSFSTGAWEGLRLSVPHYDLDVRVEDDELKRAVVTARLAPHAEDVRVARFELAPAMKVLAVETPDGRPLYHVREKIERKRWESHLTVVFPEPVRQDDRVVFELEGDIIDEFGAGQYGIKTTVGWYPTLGYLERSSFELRFDSDKRHEVFASARKLADTEQGDRRITRWLQDFPVALMSFNYGSMPTERVEVEGLPPVIVFGRESGLVTGSALKNVGADVLNAIGFFSEIFGPYPFGEMYATRIPYGHGQGFPGLLHLSASTFGGDRKGWDAYFRAHETSHQWWGHVVGWKSYRDQWLSEGFASYSGALFALASSEDEGVMREMLDAWRMAILSKGSLQAGLGMSYFGYPPGVERFSQGSEAGPISLGLRLRSSKSPMDYSLLVYRKGGWVLHMIRMLMRDFKTGSDEAFHNMMRDFVRQNHGKNASTEDFRRVVEKHAGADMGWFFDQWVHGTVIPRYEWAWKSVPAGEKHVVLIRVRQELPEDVSSFKMMVPVRLDFGSERWAVVRLPVDRPERTYELPVPLRVRDVDFNYADAVLCEVDEEGF